MEGVLCGQVLLTFEFRRRWRSARCMPAVDATRLLQFSEASSTRCAAEPPRLDPGFIKIWPLGRAGRTEGPDVSAPRGPRGRMRRRIEGKRPDRLADEVSEKAYAQGRRLPKRVQRLHRHASQGVVGQDERETT